MKKHILIIFLTLLAAVGGCLPITTRSSWMNMSGRGESAGAGAGARGRSVAVQVATAQRKLVPVEVEAIGTVSPIASVA